MMRTQIRRWSGLVLGALLASILSSGVAGAPPAAPPVKFGSPFGFGVLRLGNGIDLRLAAIPAGKFVMGEYTADEGYPDFGHEIKLTRPYYMAIYPITQRQYAQVMGMERYRVACLKEQKLDGLAADGTMKSPQSPMLFRWSEAVDFCKQLSRVTGNLARLPTEAEWERACRADTKTKYFWGARQEDAYDYVATTGNACGNWWGHPVGHKKPSPWGLYDLHNYADWCSDWYDVAYYGKGPFTDPKGPQKPGAASPGAHTLRGGSDITTALPAIREGGGADKTGSLRVVVEAPLAVPKEFTGIFKLRARKQGQYLAEICHTLSATPMSDLAGRDSDTVAFGTSSSDMPAPNPETTARPKPGEVIRNGTLVQLAIPNKPGAQNFPDPSPDVFDPLKDCTAGDLLKIKVRVIPGQSMGEVISAEPYKMAPGEDKPGVYVFQRMATVTLQKVEHPAVVLSKFLDETTLTVMNPQLVAGLDKFKTGDSVRVAFEGKVLQSIEAYKP
jgi:formylglycine-generating enzyme required for sulfatase activity